MIAAIVKCPKLALLKVDRPLMTGVTQILSAIEQGDPSAAEKLLPLVYDELRKVATARMAAENSGHTLQATALVHEAYLRLVDVQQAQHWDSRGHFFAAAAESMRRILIDMARQKHSDRRGGSWQRCELSDADRVTVPVSDELLDLDDALTRLSGVDRQAAQIVKLRVYAGMTVEEAAAVQGVSSRTAKRNWAYARAWLGRELAAKDSHLG
jgi:RNA polymerase sigma factor (TIGR02999 family)